MTDKEIKLLLDAAKMARIDPGKLSVRNPFELSGNTAIAIQSAVSLLDPAQAAQWNKDAGFKESLETVAVKAGLSQPTATSHDEQMAADRDYVVGAQDAQAAFEAKMLASFDEEAGKMRSRRQRSERSYREVGSRNGVNRTGLAHY